MQRPCHKGAARTVVGALRVDNRKSIELHVAQGFNLEVPEHSVVRARINERIKEEAASVLSSMGLTISDAFRLLLVRIAREKALPFEPLVPNTKTIAAMRAARRGHVKPVGRIKDLLPDLNAED